jgi:hypothetical protein
MLIVVAAAFDLLRADRRFATVRGITLIVVYLTCEVGGVAAAFAVWLWHRLASADDERYARMNFRLQCWWATVLLQGACRLLGLRLVVDGEPAISRGPFVVFSRHCSIGDAFIPAAVISGRHGIRLRYVMKRELLWDPCLDVVGNRLPNCFIERGLGDGPREGAAIGRLMDDLGMHDGVLIYPEGTFFEPEQRQRALARLARVGPPALHAKGWRLRYVLPPRLSGALKLLARNQGADAVFCAHAGLEGADSFRALLRGSLLGRTVRVAFWRVPFAEIPSQPEAQAEWLFDQWADVDRWIAQNAGEAAAS